MASIRFEQAVYGSFPFWSRGYDLLGRSPGCPDAWVQAFIRACQRYGEPPRGVSHVSGVFTARLEPGALILVGASIAGTDDHGRPHALAFHGLFLDRATLARLAGQPLLARSALRAGWSPADTTLPPLDYDPPRPPRKRLATSDEVPELIASCLRRGRKIAIESPAPLDDLAARVWTTLGRRLRPQKTFATWAFSNDNHFDFLASPRLLGLDLDPETIQIEHAGEDFNPLRAALRAELGAPRGPWLSRWWTRRRRLPEPTSVTGKPPETSA